jgi:ABC-type sugar transport system permease subunit
MAVSVGNLRIERPEKSTVARLSARIDRMSDRRFAVLLFLPAAILAFVVLAPPIVAVFVMSLWRIDLLGDLPSRYVGLANLHLMFSDPFFRSSIVRTIVFAAGSTALTVPLALGTALLMNRAARFSATVAVVVLLPWAIAPIVTGFFWRFMFQPTYGIATDIVHGLGLAHGPVPWLQSPGPALTIAVFATAWRSVPLLALVLLAALRSVPDLLYRAARMDGATTWQSFRAITLPAIRPTVLIATILQVIISLQVFDLLFQLTNGGPGFSTTTITYYIYNAAFTQLSLGYASMLAIFLMVIIVASSLLVIYLRGDRRQKRRQAVRESDDFEELLAAPGRLATRQRPAAAAPAARRPRRQLPRSVRTVARIAGITLLLAWSVAPTLWILIASLQPESAVTSIPVHLTWHLNFANYRSIFSSPEWLSSFQVSMEVTLGTTFFTLLISALAAFPLARLNLPGKKVVIGALVFTYTIPAIVLAIPLLLLFNHLGLTDTVIGLIVANVAFSLPLAIWLLRNVFESVPRQLESSARMDGCSRLGTLCRVTLPAASAGVAATAILLVISTWNEFLFAVVLGHQGAITVTRRIGYINSAPGLTGTPPATYQAAAGVAAMLPMLVLVILFHRRVRSGLTDSYMKM